MRLTLLLIFFFSILSGCAASSAHGVVVPKPVHYLNQQQSFLQHTNIFSTQNAMVCTDESTADFVTDDIEEDDDREHFSLKKYYTKANDVFASAQMATLSRILSYNSSDVCIYSNTSPKYISLRTLRV